MNTIKTPQKHIPVQDWDVVVIGGGPSGCTAAAAAARGGARTLLLESSSCLGGMGTIGLVSAWTPFSDQEKVIYRGMAAHVFNKTKQGMPHVPAEATEWVPIDHERLKRIYDELVIDSGAEVRFNTFVYDVVADEQQRVNALLAVGKSGLQAYRAKVYIDCSGDGDVATRAGAEYFKGDEQGELQPGTLCFVLSNVDEYAYQFGPGILHPGNPSSPIHAILASGRFPEILDNHVCCDFIGPSTMSFNAGHVWGVDPEDPQAMTRGMMLGRRLAKQLRDALAEFFPAAFGNAFLVSTAPVLGIRETRRIVGDYILCADDYAARRSFPDEICKNSYFIDIHRPKEESIKRSMEEYHDSYYEKYGPGDSYGIPYRCLTPRGLPNVLVAGRCISSDRIMQGSVRVMPACLCMGEAAGIAAALAARDDHADVHRVDTGLLRDELKKYGAYL